MSVKTLATLACLSLVGTAGGVWLGGAAVGEINPFFFSTPETSFVSDRMAYRSPDWAEVQIGEYQQAGLLDGISQGPVPGPVYASPAVATYGDSWTSAAEEQAAPAAAWAPRDTPVRTWRAAEEPVRVWRLNEEPVRVWRAAEEPRPEADPEWQRVERYAAYQVAEEEPEQESDAPQPDVYAAVQEAGAE